MSKFHRTDGSQSIQHDEHADLHGAASKRSGSNSSSSKAPSRSPKGHHHWSVASDDYLLDKGTNHQAPHALNLTAFSADGGDSKGSNSMRPPPKLSSNSPSNRRNSQSRTGARALLYRDDQHEYEEPVHRHPTPRQHIQPHSAIQHPGTQKQQKHQHHHHHHQHHQQQLPKSRSTSQLQLVEEHYTNGDVYCGQVRSSSAVPVGEEGAEEEEEEAQQLIKWGQGTYTFKNGSVFSGQWKDGKMHGFGSFYEAGSGDRYEGSWLEGRRVQGSYYYGDPQDDKFSDGATRGGTSPLPESVRQYHGRFSDLDGVSKEGRAIVVEGDVVYEAFYARDVLQWKQQLDIAAHPRGGRQSEVSQQQLFHHYLLSTKGPTTGVTHNQSSSSATSATAAVSSGIVAPTFSRPTTSPGSGSRSLGGTPASSVPRTALSVETASPSPLREQSQLSSSPSPRRTTTTTPIPTTASTQRHDVHYTSSIQPVSHSSSILNTSHQPQGQIQHNQQQQQQQQQNLYSASPHHNRSLESNISSVHSTPVGSSTMTRGVSHRQPSRHQQQQEGQGNSPKIVGDYQAVHPPHSSDANRLASRTPLQASPIRHEQQQQPQLSPSPLQSVQGQQQQEEASPPAAPREVVAAIAPEDSEEDEAKNKKKDPIMTEDEIAAALLTTGRGKPLSNRQLNAALQLYKNQRFFPKGSQLHEREVQQHRTRVGGTLILRKEVSNPGSQSRKLLDVAMRYHPKEEGGCAGTVGRRRVCGVGGEKKDREGLNDAMVPQGTTTPPRLGSMFSSC